MDTEITAMPKPSARSDGQFETVYRVLADAIAAHAFPGCAFGVLAKGEVVLQDALGTSTYEEDAFPIASETVYDIASVSKVVATTSAAMLLAQRGLLDLDTPVGELLPGFVVGRSSTERARYVTIRHLLAHNSGLPGYAELFHTAATPDGLLRACLQLPLEAEPGTRAEYSDPGFILLGKALEVIAREPLDTWVTRELFEPLGLPATRFNPLPAARAFIPPTENDTSFRQRRIQGEVQDENASVLKGVAGHAGVFSNAPDLLSFAAAILSASSPNTDTNRAPLFSKETVQQFAQRQGPEVSSRALGWDTPSLESSAGPYFSPHSIGHLGYSGCSIWIDLDADVAAVLLTNRTWPDRKNQSIRQIRPTFHNAVRLALDPSKK